MPLSQAVVANHG